MTIACSCNIILQKTFEAAIQRNIGKIAEAGDLMDAVGIVYRDARDNDFTRADRRVAIPSCTACFNTVEQLIHKAGYFTDQTIPDRAFNAPCPRRAACFDSLRVLAAE